MMLWVKSEWKSGLELLPKTVFVREKQYQGVMPYSESASEAAGEACYAGNNAADWRIEVTSLAPMNRDVEVRQHVLKA